MKHLIWIAALGALSACGADGEPITPSLNAGVTIGSGGVSTNASVGVSQGPVSIRLGL